MKYLELFGAMVVLHISGQVLHEWIKNSKSSGAITKGTMGKA